MHFDRFDAEDPTRCIFTESGSPFDTFDRKEENRQYLLHASAAQARHERIMIKARLAQWRFDLMLYLGAGPAAMARGHGGTFDRPKHTIRVKTLANDTELPALRVDYEKLEVSFRWLDMFDRLYRENKVLVSTMMRLIDENPPQPTSDPSKMMKAIRGHLKQRENVRKQIRRKRIILWYKENYDFDVKESNISSGAEKASIRRIDAAMKSVDYVRFPEDADDERDERWKENEALRNAEDESDVDDDDEEEDESDYDSEDDGDEGDEGDEGEEGEEEEDYDSEDDGELFMEADWDYEPPEGGEVEL